MNGPTTIRHLSELQLAAALLPGAEPPVCPVPGCSACAEKLAAQARLARAFHDEVMPRTLPALLARAARGEAAEEPVTGEQPDATTDATPAATTTAKPDARAGEKRDRRAAPSSPPSRGSWISSLLRPWIAGPLVAAALVLLWIAVRPAERSGAPGPAGLPGEAPYLGVKGDADPVRLYLGRAGAVRSIDDGAEVMPGDALRFSVTAPTGAAAAARYALVVSIDGAGAISVYAPFGGARSERLPDEAIAGAGAAIELSGSVVLDGTLGDERLWALVSDAPIEVAAVRPLLERLATAGPAAVRAASAATLADELRAAVPGLRVTSWLLHKLEAPL